MRLPMSFSLSKVVLMLAGLCCWMTAELKGQDTPPPYQGPPTLPGKATGQGTGQGQSGNQAIEGTQEFVQIAPGYLLFAEQFLFQDTSMMSGRAIGHVFIQLPPNFALLGITFIHADTAQFNVREGWMVLRGWPEVLMGSTDYRAADDNTRMRITWRGPNRGLTVVGNATQQTLMPGTIIGSSGN
jgi:hypothetical protein